MLNSFSLITLIFSIRNCNSHLQTLVFSFSCRDMGFHNNYSKCCVTQTVLYLAGRAPSCPSIPFRYAPVGFEHVSFLMFHAHLVLSLPCSVLESPLFLLVGNVIQNSNSAFCFQGITASGPF